MKVIRASSLDSADKRRFVELTPKVDADLQRELEYDAMLFHSAFVRETWKKQKRGRGRVSGETRKGL
jgi:hypothetical protein